MLPADILLVEDDPIDAKFFKRAVKNTNDGTRVTWVKDGQAAVDHLTAVSAAGEPLPQLVVLDIKLPKLKGFDVLRHVRSNHPTRRVPVVMLSSSTQQADIEQAYDLGANSYLSKPSSFTRLTSLVTSLLDYWLSVNTAPSNSR